MADDRQARTTSIAKSVDGLVQTENALDHARALKEQFNRAQQQSQQSRQTGKTQGSTHQQGSQMVKSDAPPLAPTPSGPMRSSTDRQIANTKLRSEHATEDRKLESARKAQEALKQRQQPNHDHEQDRDK